ncbi:MULTISPECIES: carboxypeptidase regulatory-like domain-containing protein [unclassified Curtobacterium]|uniref:carboxypeptidase regulatory-like domain-containing protein n=1 Tax=unclassified Curtobacterium TaxID=257496 RepID=UPI003821A986
MRRWSRRRSVVAGVTGIVLGAGLALGGATSASAAPVGHWGDFTVSGTSKAYTGTMTMPGFPATTFTSNSRQTTVISGASTWQGPSTGPGTVYGSSRGNTYINQRPNADSPTAAAASTTRYAFATPTPAGSWSFVLGDIDADQATITATVQGGGAATPAQLGYQSSYNSCSQAPSPGGWSCAADPDGTTGQDVPGWNATTGVLTGNTAANDTAGATAWFTPTVPLDSLTITYQQRSGFPVYQTWFASRTAALTGTATLDGTPIPGATVTVTAPRGTVYTTTTAADGTYSFPSLPQIGGYTVVVTPPDGADPLDQTGTVSLLGADGTADRAFTAPTGTTSIIGTVVDDAGNPVADVPVVITDPDDPGTPLVETTTNSEGVYTGSNLPPSTPVDVSVAGGDPVSVTTGEAGAAPVEPDPIVAPAAAIATISGRITLDTAPVAAGTVVELLDGTTLVGSTTTAADGSYTFTTVPGTYTVRTVTPADGATGAVSRPADATSGSATVDFPFVSPVAPVPVTVSQPGTVTDSNGDPAAGVDVVATPTDPEAGAPVTTTTDADGAFTLTGLAAETEYTIVAGTGTSAGDPRTVTTPATGAAAPIALVVPAAAVTPPPTSTPTPTPAPTQTPGPVPVSSGGGTSGSTGALAYTGADIGPAAIAAGVLVLLGAGLLTFRAARNRRRTTHLQD